jgi:hypothetical protein
LKSTSVIAATTALALITLSTTAHAAKKHSTHHGKFKTVQALGIPALTIKRYGGAWAFAPSSWAMDASDQGGVDLGSPDNRCYAGANILPITRSMQGYYGNMYGPPDVSMANIIALMLKGSGHAYNVHYTSAPQRFDGYFVQRSFATSEATGKIFYHIYGDVNSQYIESYYLAMTRTDSWKKWGPIATAVALSIHRSVVARSTYSGNSYSGGGDNGGGGGGYSEPDPLKDYNAQLGMQYYHDPNTGTNYWVDPSTAVVNGPDGEGVYTQNGNDITKLVPGASD